MKNIGRSIALVLVPSLSILGCVVEDEGDGSVSRAEQVLEAKENVDFALETYVECQEESASDCSSEEQELIDSHDELLTLTEGVDFRAYAVAACGGSGVSCQGAGSCYATDEVGCACVNNGMLTDVGSCKAIK